MRTIINDDGDGDDDKKKTGDENSEKYMGKVYNILVSN